MEIVEPSEIELASASPEWGRSPLSPLTNSPSQHSNFLLRKPIRRKSSTIRRIDSSEDIPSSHESIYRAERFSSTNSEDNSAASWPKITLSPDMTPIPLLNLDGKGQNIRDQLLAPNIGNTPILYGHGTALTTIVEQKSCTTMCTKGSSVNPRSASETSLATSTLNFLGHRNSFDLPSTVTLRSPRRRRSFSADDLIFIKQSYHEACAMIERRTGYFLQIHDVYAQPRTPVVPPIERPPTPPGLPSWTAAQNGPARIRVQSQHWLVTVTQNRLKRFLGIRPSPIGLSPCCPGPMALQNPNQITQVVGGGRSASSPLPANIAPRFRPIRSGHGTGLLESHPFHHAGQADTKGDLISIVTGIQTSNPPLSTRPGTLQRATKTVGGGKRRRPAYSHIAGSFRIPDLNTGSGHGGVSPQCPHRRGRRASLQRLNQINEVFPPDTSPLTVDYALLATNDLQEGSTQQSFPANTMNGPDAGVEVQASVDSPVMTGAVAVRTLTAARPAKTVHQTHRCWKCQFSTLFNTLDDTWEASTSWCCWWCCGVDLYEDGAAQSGNAQETLGPRRVVLDGMPVMLY